MRHLPCTITFIFIFFFSGLFAQNEKDSVRYVLADTVLANRLYQEGKSLINQEKYEEAYTILDMAGKIYLGTEGEKSNGYGNILNNKAIVLRNTNKLDSAAIFYKQLLAIRETLFEPSHPNVINIQYNLSQVYMNASRLSESSMVMDRIISAYQKNPLSDSTTMLIRVYRNYGILYGKLGDYKKALIKHQRDLELSEKRFGVNSEEYSHPLNNIGIVYRHLRQYDKALSYYFKSLNIKIKKEKNLFSENIAVTYGNIGGIYMELEDWDKSLIYIQKAIENYEHINKAPTIETAFQYDNLGMCYQGKKDYNSALINHLKAQSIFEENNEVNSFDAFINYYNIGEAYSQMGKIELAIGAIEKALVVLKSLGELKGEHTQMVLNKLGQIKAAAGCIDGAFVAFRTALEASGYNKNDNLPQIYSPIDLVESFRGLISTYLAQFKISKNEMALDSAIHCVKEASFYLNKLQLKLNHGEAKLTLIKYALPLVEVCLSVNNIYNKFNPNLSFDLIEKNKSQLLFESLQEVNALKFGKIPYELVDKEEQLRLDISYNEKKVQFLIGNEVKENDKNLLDVNSQLFDLKRDYENLKERFDKEYPDYYRLKYDLSTVPLSTVQQKMLTKDQTLLSYFVGDSAVYAFVVRPDTFNVYEIKKDFPLEAWVKQLRDGLYGYHTADVPTEKLYDMKADSFVQASAKLYEKIIHPLSNLLTKEVIVVPDGALGYIPFDVLLKEKPQTATAFKTHKYIGNDHIISYNYSATLWKEMREKKHKAEPKSTYIGYAPYYNGDTSLLANLFAYDETMRKGLDSLKYSGEEIFKSQKMMQGESIIGKEATKDKFTKTAGNYRIVHLATHGKANDKIGDYCFLAFTEQKDSIDNELLYVRDIYNLSLNADMVVLSACETGIGELKRGEGIISLARAFAYAGAKSIVTTLWSVNDKSTMQLMEGFYRNLKKGLSKDAALWQAKKDYIEKSKNLSAHPFYWSAFIPIGDMTKIKN